MFKRSISTRDLPRARRLHAASVAILKLDWIRKSVVYNVEHRMKRREDGTFTMRMCAGVFLKKEHIEELLQLVSTDTEPAYLHFQALDNGQMDVSVETTYPAECVLRRESRKMDVDAWWKNLDLLDKNTEIPCAKSVWSNELLSIPTYERKCVMYVQRAPPNGQMTIQFIRIDPKSVREVAAKSMLADSGAAEASLPVVPKSI